MAGAYTLFVPTASAEPSDLVADLFSGNPGCVPTLVDRGNSTLAFVLADPSQSVERLYDARSIPVGTVASLILGDPNSGIVYAESDTWAPLPAAGCTVTPIQAGNGSRPAIVDISLTPTPYGGTFTVDGLALDWDATDSEFQALFPDSFSVQKTGSFTWRMTSIANGAYTPTVDVTDLLVLTGFSFDLALDLGGYFSPLGTDELDATLQLAAVFPDLPQETFYLGEVTVRKGVPAAALTINANSIIALDGTPLTDYFGNPLLYLAAA